jgi:hypothetical protein
MHTLQEVITLGWHLDLEALAEVSQFTNIDSQSTMNLKGFE